MNNYCFGLWDENDRLLMDEHIEISMFEGKI